MPEGGNWKEMFYASEKGDVELVKYHIKMGVDPNYQHPEFLTSPLLESLRLGQLEVAKFLMENGADPHLKEAFGSDTPLSVAKSSKNKEAIKLVQSFLK